MDGYEVIDLAIILNLKVVAALVESVWGKMTEEEAHKVWLMMSTTLV